MNLLRRIAAHLNESPPLMMALLGLATSAMVAIPIGMLGIGLASQYLASDALFTREDVIRLAWVGVVGAQAAAVSLIIRLASLVREDSPPSLHFLNGLLKPFVGMTFAHLSYMVFASGVIAKPELATRDIYFYVSVAFAAGFSERFAKDLVERIPGSSRTPESEIPPNAGQS